MPTILRFEGLRAVIYPNDHRPAHVHVIGKGGVYPELPSGPPELREVIAAICQNPNLSCRRCRQNCWRYVPSGGKLMAIADDIIRQAEDFMAAERDHAHAVAAHYDRRTNRVIVSLHSGLELAIPPHLVEGLADATADALAEIEVSLSGLGLHWPQLDADLYVPTLLEGQFGSRQWMARQLGAAGGKSRSPAKSSAVRANGLKGADHGRNKRRIS